MLMVPFVVMSYFRKLSLVKISVDEFFSEEER